MEGACMGSITPDSFYCALELFQGYFRGFYLLTSVKACSLQNSARRIVFALPVQMFIQGHLA